MRYKDRMIGIATGLRIINRMSEIIKNEYRTWFPFQANDLNFMAINGMSDTISSARTIDEQIINHLPTTTESGFHQMCNGIYSIIRGMAITQSALAGVGSPLKLSD